MATQVPVAENLDAAMHILHATALNKDFQDDIHKFYDGWAKDYDKHLDNANYNGPALTAEALNKVLSDKSALILDLCAGTGRVGQELAKLGFKRIDGVDFSQQCLDISASKGVYERLICDRLGKNKIKGVDDDYYSALTCVGALSIGHLKADVFDEWNRILKKGGFMVFTLSWAMMDGDPQEHIDTMTEMKQVIEGFIQDGTWELVDKVDISLIRKVGRADMYTIRLV
ncbi:methyltransferase-like protein 27 [Asterias rubens]|uniref:methyltransferase-like protein 27 n=1 Tax=Asterias rubens TaxID=7604 RepID=UPI001455CECE|nr:methyltransferase-like protein 27 [Asterias rubens]